MTKNFKISLKEHIILAAHASSEVTNWIQPNFATCCDLGSAWAGFENGRPKCWWFSPLKWEARKVRLKRESSEENELATQP